MQIEQIDIDTLIPYVNNARTHSDEQVAQIASSIKEFGFLNPVIIDDEMGIIAGHGRVMACKKLGLKQVPCIKASHLSEAQRKAYIIADNKLALNAGWDDELLRIEFTELEELGFDLSLTGFDDLEISDLLNTIDEDDGLDGAPKTSLADKFLAPPFSVLNSREGWWQERKRSWIGLGLKSGKGRNSGLQKGMNKLAQKVGNASTMTEDDDSVFDPVLCELLYSWFSSQGSLVLDPFAGGSVRGVVASKLNRQYIGIDLRPEQIDENRKQANDLCDENNMPVWIVGDSANIDKICHDVEADFIISCPPYADLEVYSDKPNDLSNMTYDNFRSAYFEIIKKTCTKLKNDRFACFVVDEVRDKKGNYYNFVGDTIQAFLDAGLKYYNEAILVNCCGTLALRAKKPFETSRKLGKTHQNVLIFVKGDAKKATKYCGEVDVHVPSDES